MSWFIWVVLAYLFIKCLGWVISPFRGKEEEYIEEPQTVVNVNVYITDSFNTDNSAFKGGAYYGTKESNQKTSTEEDDYFTNYFGSKRRN